MTYPWGPFFRIAILTLQRREEVAAMRWSEITPDLSVWTMAGARMKNGKPHDVHLSQPAQAVLRALSEVRNKDTDNVSSAGGNGHPCDFVFSTTGPGGGHLLVQDIDPERNAPGLDDGSPTLRGGYERR